MTGDIVPMSPGELQNEVCEFQVTPEIRSLTDKPKSNLRNVKDWTYVESLRQRDMGRLVATALLSGS